MKSFIQLTVLNKKVEFLLHILDNVNDPYNEEKSNRNIGLQNLTLKIDV